MKKFLLNAVICSSIIVASTGPASAHEMFLKANDYTLAPNTNSFLQLFTGTFDKSANSVGRDRMNDVSFVHNGTTTHPSNDQWFDSNNISFLNIKTAEAGTYVAGVSTNAATITLSIEDFTGYLKHDGILDTLKDFEKNNTLKQVRERYSKHVRTIFQVGDTRTDDYKKNLGYPIEILVNENPTDLNVNDDLGFQVLFEGKPIASQLVYVSYEGFHGHDTSGGHLNAYKLRTDANGRATFKIQKPGNWYISLIHMEKITDPDADYQSDWGTVTFQVK
ncbi:MAG: hypothetical protein COB54_07570 [Alphaproteobacteria bacterium]|nr:MAG: hypothetical protein COB54_07570 [Alphaproteobacteria bacterium]